MYHRVATGWGTPFLVAGNTDGSAFPTEAAHAPFLAAKTPYTATTCAWYDNISGRSYNINITGYDCPADTLQVPTHNVSSQNACLIAASRNTDGTVASVRFVSEGPDGRCPDGNGNTPSNNAPISCTATTQAPTNNNATCLELLKYPRTSIPASLGGDYDWCARECPEFISGSS